MNDSNIMKARMEELCYPQCNIVLLERGLTLFLNVYCKSKDSY